MSLNVFVYALSPKINVLQWGIWFPPLMPSHRGMRGATNLTLPTLSLRITVFLFMELA